MKAFKFVVRSPLEKFPLQDILIYHGRFIFYHPEIIDKNQLLVPPEQDIVGFALDSSLTEYEYRDNNHFHLETYLYVYHPALGWSDQPISFSRLREVSQQLVDFKKLPEPFPTDVLWGFGISGLFASLVWFNLVSTTSAILGMFFALTLRLVTKGKKS